MIILDTDTISVLDAEQGDAYEQLARRLSLPNIDPIFVTIVSFEEQMRGWLSYIAASKTLPRQVEGYARLLRMIRWYQKQSMLGFDKEAAQVFEQLRRARTKVGSMDLKIAAIARSRDALLLSRNLKDFGRIPGIQVEDWTRQG